MPDKPFEIPKMPKRIEIDWHKIAGICDDIQLLITDLYNDLGRLKQALCDEALEVRDKENERMHPVQEAGKG